MLIYIPWLLMAIVLLLSTSCSTEKSPIAIVTSIPTPTHIPQVTPTSTFVPTPTPTFTPIPPTLTTVPTPTSTPTFTPIPSTPTTVPTLTPTTTPVLGYYAEELLSGTRTVEGDPLSTYQMALCASSHLHPDAALRKEQYEALAKLAKLYEPLGVSSEKVHDQYYQAYQAITREMLLTQTITISETYDPPGWVIEWGEVYRCFDYVNYTVKFSKDFR